MTRGYFVSRRDESLSWAGPCIENPLPSLPVLILFSPSLLLSFSPSINKLFSTLSSNLPHSVTNHFYETCLKYYYNHHASIPFSAPLSSTIFWGILRSPYSRESRGRKLPEHKGCHNTPLPHDPDFILQLS